MEIVGVAHSHPNFGVFISGATQGGESGDDTLHEKLGPRSLSIIADPVRGELSIYSRGGTARNGAKLNHIGRTESGVLYVDRSSSVVKQDRGVRGAHGFSLHKELHVENPITS